jgi:hypothetical protein
LGFNVGLLDFFGKGARTLCQTPCALVRASHNLKLGEQDGVVRLRTDALR